MEYQIGDRVQIREWDDMAEEFGLLCGEIQCRKCFVQDMKPLCGMVFTIKDIDGLGMIEFEEECPELFRKDYPKHKWFISLDMIKPYDHTDTSFNNEVFLDMIFS